MANPLNQITGIGDPNLKYFGYAGQVYTDTQTGDVWKRPDQTVPGTTGWYKIDDSELDYFHTFARLIIDTDMVEDPDDAYDLHTIFGLANQGNCEVLAAGSCLSYDEAPLGIRAIANFFGYYNLPIGQTEGNIQTSNPLGATLAQFVQPQEFEGTTEVYRRALSSQPDKSVTLLFLGQAVNLKALYLSPPDRYSDLNGRDLIERKVLQIVFVAGEWPSGSEYNFYTDPSSMDILPLLPVRTIWTCNPQADDTLCGEVILDNTMQSPTRAVYLTADPNNNRPVWGRVGILFAIYGDTYKGERLFSLSPNGTITVNTSTGSNGFSESSDGLQNYLIREVTAERLTEISNELLAVNPVNESGGRISVRGGQYPGYYLEGNEENTKWAIYSDSVANRLIISTLSDYGGEAGAAFFIQRAGDLSVQNISLNRSLRVFGNNLSEVVLQCDSAPANERAFVMFYDYTTSRLHIGALNDDHTVFSNGFYLNRGTGATINSAGSECPFKATKITSESNSYPEVSLTSLSGGVDEKTWSIYVDQAANQLVIATVNDAGGAVSTAIKITRSGNSASLTEISTPLLLTALPTSNPMVAGAVWNDSGTLKISAG